MGELRGMLARGVGFHHAGMLPLQKEMVERLFATGLLKVLYTTETFALGINMPARAVVFDSLTKFDGIDFDYMRTRDYMQMAGRAGRLGMDEEGLDFQTALDEAHEVDPVGVPLEALAPAAGQVEHRQLARAFTDGEQATTGIEAGAQPDDWFVTNGPIPACEWRGIQVWRGNWETLRWQQIVLRTRPKGQNGAGAPKAVGQPGGNPGNARAGRQHLQGSHTVAPKLQRRRATEDEIEE